MYQRIYEHVFLCVYCVYISLVKIFNFHMFIYKQSSYFIFGLLYLAINFLNYPYSFFNNLGKIKDFLKYDNHASPASVHSAGWQQRDSGACDRWTPVWLER